MHFTQLNTHRNLISSKSYEYKCSFKLQFLLLANMYPINQYKISTIHTCISSHRVADVADP